MKEIFINVDSYNNEGIKTIQGNNNAEVYKICISKSKVRLSLVGKTVKLGYVMAGTTKGDIIEDLNISNAEQGEITFPITNKISKKDGVYTCQLAIYGLDEFLEYTATFGLTVEANIFTKIAEGIKDTKDLTYIERILEEAKTVSRDLKTNIPVATNLNSSLESNISNARNINTTLADTAEKSKVAATNAIEKKNQLESSIVEAKKFIDGLDGSQNIPGIRMELTELQNGLKSNQALSYEGSSISAENTLEGRTEGMKIKGRTLQNLFYANQSLSLTTKIGWINSNAYLQVVNEKYTLVNNTDLAIEYQVMNKDTGLYKNTIGVEGNSIVIYTLKENEIITRCEGLKKVGWTSNDLNKLKNTCYILKGDWTDKPIPNFFEGIKSFGEAEQEGDKYKISILSNGKNLFNHDDLTGGEVVTFNNKKCYKYKDGANNFSLPINGVLGKQYTLSIKMYRDSENISQRVNFAFHYDDGTKNTTTFNNNSLVNYTTTSGKRLVKITGSFNHNSNCYIDLECTQLEEGTVATSYEPYKEDKKDILIKEPIKSVGNISDIIYEDNGQVKVNRYNKKIIIGGNENLIEINNSGSMYGVKLKIEEGKRYSKFISDSKIGYDERWNVTNWENNYPLVFNFDNNIGYISILFSKNKISSITNLETCKQYLRENNIELYYQLATPIVEIVENCVDIDLDTYQEKTYFNILNSLPGTLDFKVPSNIGSLVRSNAKEINNINEFINNFILKALLEMNKDLAAIKIKNGLN